MLCAIVVAAPMASFAGYRDTFVQLLEAYYGAVCTVKIEGWRNKTLRVDWTGATVKLHAIKVLAEIGEAKEELYEDGIRYLKFPNDSGGYNVIDWKTGEIKSIDERAPYYFTE
jgi:hypothetical protein